MVEILLEFVAPARENSIVLHLSLGLAFEGQITRI
jgi:hypothetical protein